MAGAGNRTGIVSGIMDSFLDDEPDMRGKLVVFDPQVFKRTKNLLSDWTANRDQWQSLFGKWKADFEASQPQFKENIDRENDYLKYLRDGGFEKTLSGLRSRERANDQAEKENALDFAGGSADRAKLASGAGIGSSSADFARRIRSGQRIEAEFGGRDSMRERADLDWVNRMKLGTMGRINSNIDALVNRQLAPQQLSDHELMTMIQALSGIQGIRLGAAQPVFWREKSDLERTADTMDSLADGYFKGMNVASSWMGGGMGGGMGGASGGAAGGASGAQTSGMSGMQWMQQNPSAYQTRRPSWADME